MHKFCSRCGEELDGGSFCSACGAPVEAIEGQPAAPDAQQIGSRAATPSGEILLGPDGVYRWAYDFKLFKNPTILLLLWKIFGFIALGIYVFVFFLSLGDHGFWFEGFFELTKVFVFFMLGMMALTLLGYLVYAIIMGGKYCVLFEMDEKGVTHTQAPKQFKKAQVFSAITAVTATDVGTLGTAILAGSKSASHSEWRLVKSISCHPHTCVIKVNAPLNKNQVYAAKEDFAFVRDYIVSHCPNAKLKG